MSSLHAINIKPDNHGDFSFLLWLFPDLVTEQMLETGKRFKAGRALNCFNGNILNFLIGRFQLLR
jgi:hypothetical protein